MYVLYFLLSVSALISVNGSENREMLCDVLHISLAIVLSAFNLYLSK